MGALIEYPVPADLVDAYRIGLHGRQRYCDALNKGRTHEQALGRALEGKVEASLDYLLTKWAIEQNVLEATF